MTNRACALSFGALSLTALGFLMLPHRLCAQETLGGKADTVSNEQLNKPINLDVRSANLYYALTLLFDQLKIGNYTIPDVLKQQEVSAHFTQLPLRTALDTLLKNSGYTYNVNDGVYNVVPKVEEKSDAPIELPREPVEPTTRGKKIYRLNSNQIIFNSYDLVTRLGGRVLPNPAGANSNSSSMNGMGGQGGLGNGQSGLGGGQGGFGGSGSTGVGSSLGGGLGGFGGTRGNTGFGGRGGGGF